MAMVRQSSGLDELKDVLGAADVVVQRREEFEEALAKAEARGEAPAGAMTVLERYPSSQRRQACLREWWYGGAGAWGHQL